MVRIFHIFCLAFSGNCLKCLNCFRFLIWFFLAFFQGNEATSTEIDTGISQAVRDSDKISMTKNTFEWRVGTTLTAEKAPCFKRTQLIFGKAATTSINNHVTFPSKRQTCLKWEFFMSNKPINLIRTIRKCIILTTSS